jgi:uncharacterized protein Yka (UPF0111/DUF47 family)
MLGHLRNEDKRLFEQLARITQYLASSAALLERLLASPKSGAYAIALEARELGAEQDLRRGDDDVDVRAFAGFAMRLDAVEFRELAIALDATAESVRDATAHVDTLDASNAPDNLRAIAHTLTSAATALQETVPFIRAARQEVLLRNTEIQRLAHVGEALYYDGVGALFAGTPDVVDVVRWKDIYDKLRRGLESCARSADVIDQLAAANT